MIFTPEGVIGSYRFKIIRLLQNQPWNTTTEPE